MHGRTICVSTTRGYSVRRVFDVEDMATLSELVCDTWERGSDSDWSARAGTVEWTCTETADHAVDTVLASRVRAARRAVCALARAHGGVADVEDLG